MQKRLNIAKCTRESLIRQPKLALAGDTNMVQQQLIYQMAPGICVTFPMMEEDLNIMATVEDYLQGGNRKRARQLETEGCRR